ncbi:bifunctional phosphopantothenoylcysteine decarboxylase/phosphopantothenate--cysteine ligase CoaBC [Vibrio gazogenes]|uniref:Coenzyme A biosynthesis bifunctional protein CoaBC n=1 Tax=Vibrio gazogenes DSM 21264 = NBRC 103151 TaxID=1123492 RepID=A0A1M5CY86_VIBGA|nr:bifunctional phosphopantothenoylcysteine decarboxylase/phosphopantothenate--cysteine ligase CoaBC [Vibrio gazogenes]USP13886.1 bifunctional phosphopantothenoylcysteine decarboxylase/phosphopantothenate--cysteine ligase CoaBC [Vibrio gazogenes]SHF59686.1 phosphopantothenoylcysteine decarboxylase / phosphopantothenate--cysteine ligase [Vibrio gazogenes DSM 21264] [Vibrio gazogenes DSM 21264 = NBRC 103151]
MQTLAGKKILLGISGGIAAYKCAELTRRLIEHGAEIRVVMTDAAKSFITPLTMQAVSGYPVSDSLLDPAAERSMGHIELAKWADLILLAPASADLIARIAAGMGNDLLSTLILATQAPVALAPAMNQQMYRHVATQRNLETLASFGMYIWGPDAGEQACGDVGPGRMLEPMQLVQLCEQFFHPKLLTGKSVLITAGPTREALDPVRYMTNHSSGKMGFEIARAAAQLGADVTLIAGPTHLSTPIGAQRIDVSSAATMYDAVMMQAPEHDVFISCAAVADYRPADIADQKIKKTDDSDTMTITLVKNPDIVASVAAMTTHRPFTVGFAAETQQVEQYARSKMARKNLDMICANDVSVSGQGFNSDQNALHLFWPTGEQKLPLAPKSQLALALMTLISEKIG